MDLAEYANNYTGGVVQSWRDLYNSMGDSSVGSNLLGEGEAAVSAAKNFVVSPLSAIAKTVNRVLPEPTGGEGSRAAVENDINSWRDHLTTPSNQTSNAIGNVASSLFKPVGDSINHIASYFSDDPKTQDAIKDGFTTGLALAGGVGAAVRSFPKSTSRFAYGPVGEAPPPSLMAEAAERRTGGRAQPTSDALENNASGESSASVEAINRVSSEKAAGQNRYLINPDGNMTPLTGVDSVDAIAPKGHLIVQQGIGADEYSILDRGGLPQAHAKGLLNRALTTPSAGLDDATLSQGQGFVSVSPMKSQTMSLSDVKSYAQQNGMSTDQAAHFLGMSGYRIN